MSASDASEPRPAPTVQPTIQLPGMAGVHGIGHCITTRPIDFARPVDPSGGAETTVGWPANPGQALSARLPLISSLSCAARFTAHMFSWPMMSSRHRQSINQPMA
jgi:hypothetical protein